MDPTAEDKVQLSGNCKETCSLLQTLDEIEEFLQDLPETHEARTPTAPEPQFYMPLTTPGEDSQQGSFQNQVMAPLKSPMINMFPGDLNEALSMDQKVSSFDQRKPTTATPRMTDVADNSKTLFTDCQKTAITTNNMIISNEGSQMKTLNNEHTLYRDQMTFSGHQTLYGDQMTFSGDQTHYGGQMNFSGDQSLYGVQMKSLNDDQTFYGDQMTFSGDQTRYGGQMNFNGDQSLYGVQRKSLNDDQTFYGDQMTFSGHQSLYGDQMTFSGDQDHYGCQMTSSGDWNLCGVQMKSLSNDQTLCGDKMTFSGYQSLYWDQMTFREDQNFYGSQRGNQMTSFTDDHTLYRSCMIPCQSSSLPYPGLLHFSNSSLIQGQSLEKQKSKVKIQTCLFQKNLVILKPYTCTYQDCGKSYSKRSQLQIHERKHTGEKPYKCNVNGCTWEFTRADELSRHNRKHSGERPYLCTLCNKNFARSDHLKQHQRVHGPL